MLGTSGPPIIRPDYSFRPQCLDLLHLRKSTGLGSLVPGENNDSRITETKRRIGSRSTLGQWH